MVIAAFAALMAASAYAISEGGWSKYSMFTGGSSIHVNYEHGPQIHDGVIIGPYDPIIGDRQEYMERRIFEITNYERMVRGVGELERHPQLDIVALNHSKDMVEREFFDHVNPSGLSPHDRLSLMCEMSGENIAYRMGYDESDEWHALDFMRGWMDSKGHRDNILFTQFDLIGVGVYEFGSEVYATQVFCR